MPNGRQPADHRIGANSAELVDRNSSGHERAVLHSDVPRHEYVVCQDRVITDVTIMCDVRAHHNCVVVADQRAGAFVHRAVNHHVFSDRVGVPNYHLADAVRDLQMLWYSTQYGAF